MIKEKYRIKQEEWKRNNKQRINAKMKEWRHRLGISKEYHVGEYLRNCPEGTKEKEKIANKLWKQKNREKMNKSNRKYMTKFSKEEKRNRINSWRRKNPLKYKTQQHRRRVLQRDLQVETVQRVYEDNIKKYGTLTCYLCLKQVPFGKDTLEHKIPLSRGGTNLYENLEISCFICNCRKGNKTVEEFKQLIEKGV